MTQDLYWIANGIAFKEFRIRQRDGISWEIVLSFRFGSWEIIYAEKVGKFVKTDSWN